MLDVCVAIELLHSCPFPPVEMPLHSGETFMPA